jgi:hypothetical protein
MTKLELFYVSNLRPRIAAAVVKVEEIELAYWAFVSCFAWLPRTVGEASPQIILGFNELEYSTRPLDRSDSS